MIAVQPLAAQVGVAPACQALGVSRATFYRRQRSTPGHRQPRPTPARALCEAEREQILDVLAGPRFVDRAPAEVVATLLDEGHYLCSERTMYRILAADQPVRERRNQREHPQYTKPELVATAPNQTWSWDITKLLGPTKWTYFYLYVVLDIFSRYAVGWMVADRENSALAGRLIEETCHKQGVQPQVLTLHSDRGAPMTSKCTAQLLADLGVTRSLSRPQVSDDNPFSEAQFKTLKYHPGFPGRFHDITAAIAFCRTFFPWYNTEHRHGGIAMLTPDDVHHNRTQSVLEQRGRTLQAAWTRHPERFVRGIPATASPSPSRLDQPTCDTHNRRNCSVNRNRHCLKVVDRFRPDGCARKPPRTSSISVPVPAPSDASPPSMAWRRSKTGQIACYRQQRGPPLDPVSPPPYRFAPRRARSSVVEHLTFNQRVPGSNPGGRTNKFNHFADFQESRKATMSARCQHGAAILRNGDHGQHGSGSFLT